MLWTKLTEKALNISAKMHDGQYRKGPERLPVITHLVAVANIVSAHTDDEEVVVAALLHDTIEDTSYTKEDMEHEFGSCVTDLVCGVTIPEAHDGEPHTWSADRRRYYHNIKEASDASALIAAADKLHNFRSVLDAYTSNPNQFWKDFGGTAEDRVHVYGAIVEAIVPRIPPRLADDLLGAWEKYRLFVNKISL
jgi:(p)ppGpp synthase/HD superfamily hydrolase